MGKANLKITKMPEKVTVELGGTIDEDVDFSQLDLKGSNVIEIELSNVKSINSCGIREWIKWIGTAGSAPISFLNCSKVIIDQINMVDGFLPLTAKVKSFFVPYYNDDLGSEKNILFQYGKEFTEQGVKPPESVKDDKGNPLEMDVIEAKYFKFIFKK